MRLDLQNESLDYLLEQWGKWAASEGYGGIAPGTLSGLTGSTVKSACILDEHAEVIDGVVSRMKKEDPLTGEIICMYYIKNMNHRKIASILKLSPNKTFSLFKIGIGWIRGSISQISEDAA